MASSDNQGLQIAVIIFALLTIIMSGATFYVFKLSEDAELRAVASAKAAADDKKSLADAVVEIEELRKKIGPQYIEQPGAVKPLQAKVDELTKLFNEDMAKYASTLPQEQQTYSVALQTLMDGLKAVQVTVIKEQKDLDDLKAHVATLEGAKTASLVKHETEAKTALDESTAVRGKFNEDRTKLNDDKKQLNVELQKKNDELVTLASERDKIVADVTTKLKKLELLNEQKQEIIDTVTAETFEVADGEIRWVSPATKSVWINLGRADSLHKQVSFGVFGIDDNGVARKKSKAKIEVTQILGDHLAEGRIVEDSMSDPIIIGDKLFTPLWHPGRPEHFAIAGVIDMDNDQISDIGFLRDLLSRNGAVLDAELLPDGTVQGGMSVNTRYLVLGSVPQVKPDAYGEMQSKAKQLGVETIGLQKFLDQMGWKDSSKVVKFGRDSDPKDFQYNPNDNRAHRITPSNIGQFRRREAPTSSGNTAFTKPPR